MRGYLPFENAHPAWELAAIALRPSRPSAPIDARRALEALPLQFPCRVVIRLDLNLRRCYEGWQAS
jgi:hypothetical protein